MNGTGKPTSKPRTGTCLCLHPSASCPGDEIGQRLDHAEADDEGDHKRCRRYPELFRSDERDDRPLDPDHSAHQGVHQHQERELTPILAQPEPDGRAFRLWNHALRCCGFVLCCGSRIGDSEALRPARGAGGISAIMKRTNSASSSIRKAALWRFSKPIVDQGLPLRRRPQTEPA